MRQVGGWQHLAQAENVAADRARFLEAYDRAIEKQDYMTRRLPQIAALAERLSLPVTHEFAELDDRQMSAQQMRLEFVPTTPTSTPSSRLTCAKEDYLAYSVVCSDEDCIAAFEWTFGHPPAEVVRTGGAVLVGPLCITLCNDNTHLN